MIRWDVRRSNPTLSLPRMRGDDPWIKAHAYEDDVFAPHARG